MRSRTPFFASSAALLEGRRPAPQAQRSSSEAVDLSWRDAPRTSEGVGDEGGLIWGSRLVGGNQIVKNKDFLHIVCLLLKIYLISIIN